MSGREVPAMTTDEAAEAFLDKDLSDLDFRQFRPLSYEAELKTAGGDMRLPEPPARARSRRGRRSEARRISG